MTTESQETIGFVNWFRSKFPGIIIFHIPNEGKRSIMMNKRLVAEGMIPGIPDLCVPQWNLFIEMKRENGRLSQVQRITIKKLEAAGQTVIVGYGARDASKKILVFIKESCFYNR